jgi:16S rRNA (cytosine967-C5)-methyltransferase
VLSGSTAGLRMQDIGSQTVVPLLDLRPGVTFLDLCAAPGIKTAQALETPGVRAIACDLYAHRLRHVSGCARVSLDATQPLPFRREFDRVLVDAPCSGTGTLGRNPEIRWKLRPEDLEDLHDRQAAILRRALDHLKPGGRLVYATCSLERRENEDVVSAVGAHVVHTHRRIPGIDAGDGFYAAVIELP